MPNQNQTELGRKFMQRQLPWVLGGMMLLIYLITINHWVTLANIMPVAKVSGFLWQPDLYNPLTMLFTSPFRLLPAKAVPLALNLFSVICAALTMVLLARSVIILPQDRTMAQRMRERNPFAFLTGKYAWFPPVLAVLMLGMQFGFWENATSFTSESLNLLIFATIIWLLLEYRLDERAGRLTLAAFIYGAGMTENWALIGFLPVFIIAVLWIRGREFFNLQFLTYMFLSGLAGLLFFLLPPIVARISGEAPYSIFVLLKPALQTDWGIIKSISIGQVRNHLLLMSVTTFLPLLVMSIRWSGTFGDTSYAGKLTASQMFHVIHAVVFGVCMWVMFDPPFSPGQLAFNSSALTFYYLSTLAIGYYCGYFLLVFGKKSTSSRRSPRPEPALPASLEFLTPVIYWGTYAVAAVLAATLLYKNLSLILKFNDDTLARYARSTVDSLPEKGGILLSDSETVGSNPLSRTLLIQAELARTGRARDFLMVDTAQLKWAPYSHYLHEQAPDKWPEIPGDQQMAEIKDVGILSVLAHVATSNSIYYLNPSYGYYFEVFYQEPHGLVYAMKKLPAETLMPPPLSTNLIAENQTFWQRVIDQDFPRLEREIVAPAIASKYLNPAQKLIRHLRGQSLKNPNALLAAELYSRSLDNWGVELQRNGKLAAAAECFTNAVRVDPDNVIASINLNFNHQLQAGDPVTIDPSRVSTEKFGKYNDWNSALNANGPIDDPSFLFVNSVLVYRNGLMRQVVAPLHRIVQLAPDFLPARIWLAKIYLYNRLADNALDALQAPITQPDRFGLNQTNSIAVNTLAAYAYFQKDNVSQGADLLNKEIAIHPADTNLLTSAAQAFFARRLYTNVLKVADLALDQQPDAPQWLFGKGIAYLQMSNYDATISVMTHLINVATNDARILSSARLNRAIAYSKIDQLDKARADLVALQSTYTNAPQIAYQLGEVAEQQHDTNEAIRNYEIFLANVPTNAPAIKIVRERLDRLQKK